MDDHELAFNKAVQDLEEKIFEDALETVRQNCKVRDFVHGTDKRSVRSEKFQYRYRGINSKGWTLLHYALAYNQVEIVKLLLYHGAGRVKHDAMSKSPLKEESIYCNYTVQEQSLDPLLRMGSAELSTAEDTSTANWLNPLDVACLCGEEDTIEHFLSFVKEVRGDEECTDMINRKNGFGWLPIHYIAERKKARAMRLLLHNGADPTILDDRYKRNVLHFCARVSAHECLAVLTQHGKKSRYKRIESDGEEAEGTIDMGIDEVDYFGNTALHSACRKDDAGTAKMLLDMGATINLSSKQKRTPLYVSVKNGSEQCAMLLLNHPKLSLISNEELLKEALYADWPRVVIGILKKWDHQRTASKTFLHTVVKRNVYSEEEFREVVTLLGKDYIELTDEQGRTPIMLAALLNRHRMLTILLHVYLDILLEVYTPKSVKYKSIYQSLIDQKDGSGACSIHLAVTCDGMDEDFERTVSALERIRKRRCLRSLLKDHCHEHLRDSDGKTAVHLALESEKADRALHLLELRAGNGADLSDSSGCTIIHSAVMSKISASCFNKVLKMITSLKTYDELVSLFKKRNNDGKAALHLALESKLNVRAVSLLKLEKDGCYIVDPNYPDGDGKNAIHIATAQGLPVELLLQRKCDYTGVQMGNMNLRTARLLIEDSLQAQSPDVCSKFLKGALKSAIEEDRTDIVELLLVDSKDKLKIDLNILKTVILDKENEEVALLLVRHYHDDVDILTLLNEEVGDHDQQTILFHELIKRMEDVAEEALYRNMVVDSGEKRRCLNTKYYLLEGFAGDRHVISEQHLRSKDPLALIVRYRRFKLLRHPVVVDFLESKWETYGLPLYLLRLIAFLFIIIPLTVLFFPKACDPVDLSVDNVNGTSNCDHRTRVTNGFAGLLIFTLTVYKLVPLLGISYALIGGKLDLSNLFFPIKKKLSSYLYVLIFLLSYIFAILSILNANTGCCEDPKWYFGLLSFILCWANMIKLLSKFPFIGQESIVYFTIVRTFLKLLIFGSFLLLASAIILMAIFFDPQATRSPFGNLGRGLATVLTMVAGELDYIGAFGFSYAIVDNDVPGVNRPYQNTSLVVWVPFVILIPLVLNNMLTALAVGDIIELERTAEFRKFEEKVKSVLSAEYYLNIRKIRKDYKRGKQNLEQNRFVDAYAKLTLFMRKSFAPFIKRIWKTSESSKVMRKEKMGDYQKRCKAERERLRQKHVRADQGLKQSNAGTVESIDNVKEVALSCERKIKELKVVFNDAFKKLEAKVLKLGELSSKEKVDI